MDLAGGRIAWQAENITILGEVTEDNTVDQIEAAATEAQFVIVDLKGTASLMVASAIGMSDLVVIPSQGASMDAKGAAKTTRLIRNQGRLARRQISNSVLLTQRGHHVPRTEERAGAARQGSY